MEANTHGKGYLYWKQKLHEIRIIFHYQKIIPIYKNYIRNLNDISFSENNPSEVIKVTTQVNAPFTGNRNYKKFDSSSIFEKLSLPS